MKVKFFTTNLFEGKVYEKGKEYEIDEKTAGALSGMYEVISKEIKNPPKDKMMRKTKTKKVV